MTKKSTIYYCRIYNMLPSIIVFVPGNRCRPLLLPSTGCKVVNHEVFADGMYLLRAIGRRQ